MRHRENLVRASDLAVGTGDELGGVAVFVDLENIILELKDDFSIKKVIDALNERGDVMIMRAYADWGRYRRDQRQFLEEGVQMVFLPSYGVGDKNRTDTAICVDAMEILFTREHIDTFVICSGDSDFGILAQRLRDHAKRVVGLSAKNAASNILVKQCHEFIFYETLVGKRVQGYSHEDGEKRLKRALEAVVDGYGSTFRASLLKDRMRKQDKTFSERNYGATSFTRFLANYDHLVTVLEGGRVSLADKNQKQGPRQLPKLAPEVEAEARQILTEAVLAACKNGQPARPSRLKDSMNKVAPNFDEQALGYTAFSQFLRAFPDIVKVDRNRNTTSPAAGLAAPSETNEESKTLSREDRRAIRAEARRGLAKPANNADQASANKAAGRPKPAAHQTGDDRPTRDRPRQTRARNRAKPAEELERAAASDDGDAQTSAAKQKATAKKKAPSTDDKTRPAQKRTAKKDAEAPPAEAKKKARTTRARKAPAIKSKAAEAENKDDKKKTRPSKARATKTPARGAAATTKKADAPKPPTTKKPRAKTTKKTTE